MHITQKEEEVNAYSKRALMEHFNLSSAAAVSRFSKLGIQRLKKSAFKAPAENPKRRKNT